MKEFKGKIAVVTGAAHGFGAAIAEECAKREMKLVLADIDGAALDAMLEKIKAAGCDAIAVQGDMSLYEDVQKVIAAAMDQYGSVDLLVNNAGVYFHGTVWEMPARDFQWMMEANVLSIIYGMKEAIPIMMKQESRGHIVNVCSIAGLISNRTMTAYHASKHAAVAASEATFYDLQKAEAGIGMTIFCPGYIQTDLYHSYDHRPERFQAPDDPYYQTEAFKKNVAAVDRFITGGEPIDVVVPNVFGAIENDQFYVKTEATEKLFNPWMQKRWDNILNNNNPDMNKMF